MNKGFIVPGKSFLSLFGMLCICITTTNTHAFGLSLHSSFVNGSTTQIEIAIVFDFRDVPMFGGGLDVHFDTDVYQFVRYQQPFCHNISDPRCSPASPIGDLVEPGLYEGVGVGTFDFFTGLNTLDLMGTFTFNATVLPDFGDSLCIEYFCLMPNAMNPWYSLAGENVNHIIFNQVPIPGAAWFLLSGLGLLFGISGSSTRALTNRGVN